MSIPDTNTSPSVSSAPSSPPDMTPDRSVDSRSETDGDGPSRISTPTPAEEGGIQTTQRLPVPADNIQSCGAGPATPETQDETAFPWEEDPMVETSLPMSRELRDQGSTLTLRPSTRIGRRRPSGLSPDDPSDTQAPEEAQSLFGVALPREEERPESENGDGDDEMDAADGDL